LLRPVRTLPGLTGALGIASTIVLLGGAALAHPAAVAAEALPTHVVQPGETLWRIAHQAGVDVATLRRLNGLAEDDVLVAGRRLVLPSAVTQPVSPTPSARTEARHTVAPGETVWRIARQYGTTVAAVLAANGLEHAEQLRAGAEIRVPDGRPEPTAPAAPAPQQATAAAAGGAAAAPAPTPPPAAPIGPALARLAQEQVGRPYRWGGSDPAGFDCSGLVWFVAREAGRPAPRDLPGQYASGPHPGIDDLRPGDLVFNRDTYMPGLSHDGIYIGNHQFVSAVDESHGVAVASLSSPYWLAHFFGITRLP
jgi:cell wall-associated NlpC family hydrolase